MQVQLYSNQFYRNKYNFKSADSENTDTDNISAKKKVDKTSNTFPITIATLATVCAALLLSKGTLKSISQSLDKFKRYLEGKRIHSSIQNSKKQTKIYEHFIRRLNSFIKKSESINNITSLKDILFMKLMYKTKPTKQIHDSITNYFEKISKKTVFDSYKKTENNFNQMNKILDELDEYILKHSGDETVKCGDKEVTKRELIKEARSHREEVNIAVGAVINPSTIQYRYDYIKEVTSSLYSTFWDASFKDFWSKNNKFKRKEMWQTFIAAEQIKGNKTKLAEYISVARNIITCTNNDAMSNIFEYINNLDGIMPIKDSEGIKIIKKLKWFTKNPDIFQNNKELFLEELNKLQKHEIIGNSDSNIIKTLEEYKNRNIDFIKKLVKENKQGALQDMLSIYYKIAPYELEESGALLAIKRAAKSFDKSANLESVELFDKVRDLRLGSAPTDILTILLSFITLSYGLGHAKDKDQRTSIMLKSGIPIVGGIATAMYTAARLVSGGKSLALGLLSGVILNQLGKIVDNVRKNSNIKEKSANQLT